MLETLSNVGFDSGTVKGIDSIVCFLLLLLLFPELKEKNGLSLGWVRGFSFDRVTCHKGRLMIQLIKH